MIFYDLSAGLRLRTVGLNFTSQDNLLPARHVVSPRRVELDQYHNSKRSSLHNISLSLVMLQALYGEFEMSVVMVDCQCLLK